MARVLGELHSVRAEAIVGMEAKMRCPRCQDIRFWPGEPCERCGYFLYDDPALDEWGNPEGEDEPERCENPREEE